jgi:hypothetical protein
MVANTESEPLDAVDVTLAAEPLPPAPIVTV